LNNDIDNAWAERERENNASTIGFAHKYAMKCHMLIPKTKQKTLNCTRRQGHKGLLFNVINKQGDCMRRWVSK